MIRRLKNTPWSGWYPALILGSLLVVTGIIVACSSGSAPVASGMAKVHVTLSDPATCAAPDGPYSAVWVTVTDVQANIISSAGSGDSGWVDLTPNLTKNGQAVQVNLLGEANNQCFLADLGDNLELQAGSYGQIRLILADTTAGLTLTTNAGADPAMSSTDQCQGVGAANCVVVGSGNSAQTYPLQLSSQAKTGLKIPPGQIAGGAFTISAGQTKDLNIDFNTCESIVQQGNGNYRLKPVLHAAEVGTTSASLNGTVLDALGHPVAGAMVALEQPDSADPTIDRIVQSAITSADGTWVLCPVTGGNPATPYDVVIVGSDAQGVMLSPAVVTGVTPGSTLGTVTLSTPSSLGTPLTAATSVASLTGQMDTTSSTNSGVSMDVTAYGLELVNGQTYTIPLPMTATQNSGSLWLNLQTAANQTPACKDANNFCANYTVELPVTAAFYGAWSSGGVTLTQPSSAFASYVIDGIAGPASDTSITPAGTTGCTPNEMQSAAVALTSSTTYPAAVPELDFTSCQ
ncbi:MAG TPA: DUF4382 domain-containing protein [Terracidiphilus sp.]|nr:DUF4382 domain-containing protein [Terracidiphilus sp.]